MGGAPSLSCPAKILGAGNTNRTLQVGGKSRSYVLHVPSAYKGTTPVPFIIDFHGHGGTGVSQASDSPYPYFRGKAQTEQALAETGVSFGIVRPTVVFGPGDVLINNIAWLLLGETISSRVVAGGLAVFAGVLLIATDAADAPVHEHDVA